MASQSGSQWVANIDITNTSIPRLSLGSFTRVYGLIWHGDYTSLNGGPQPLEGSLMKWSKWRKITGAVGRGASIGNANLFQDLGWLARWLFPWGCWFVPLTCSFSQDPASWALQTRPRDSAWKRYTVSIHLWGDLYLAVVLMPLMVAHFSVSICCHSCQLDRKGEKFPPCHEKFQLPSSTH